MISFMNPKQLHDFLLKMYDFAEYEASQIMPDSQDNGQHFINLITVENLMDTYGRGAIFAAAKSQPDIDESAGLKQAHQKIDELRQRINEFYEQYDFDEDIKSLCRKLSRDWLHDKSDL